MRRPRVLLLLLLSTALAAPSAALLPAASAAAPVIPRLTAVRAASHPTFDRVVFEFSGGLPARRTAAYVDRLLGDASGLPVRIAGRAVLQVTFSLAAAHDSAGRLTTPARTAYALRTVMTTVRSGDNEAVLTYGIGLTGRQPFRVWTLTGPPRVVVDITAPSTVLQRVWFFDERRFVANQQPFFRPVWRHVLPTLPGTSLMHRLYAGPTPAEQQTGLRLLLSGSTGFTSLSAAQGIARVRLVGGCRSGGSTVTIAGSILPTLRQLRQVDHVKVYDPQGRTARPTGQTDSVPECLEP